MSTFYIYPLEGHGQPLLNNKQELLDSNSDTSTTTITSLGSTELSRILEIPLNLLDTAKDQQQMIWLPNTNHVNTSPTNTSTINATEIPNTTNEFESGIVTHSFANRKRSIVKRRKSVLSASFTAEDEAEAIRTDREATLAALERGHHEHHHQSEENKEYQESREIEPQEELVYSQKNLTFNLEDEDRPSYFSMNHNSVLSMGRSSLSRRGEGSKSEHHVPQQVEQPNTKGVIVVINPKDSAIDLPTVVLEQANDSSIMSCVANLSESPPSSPSEIPPMTKKKVSSWSPRRIFSSNSETKKIAKKPSSASLDTVDETSTKQEKFHLSSLFSRKSNNGKKKKKGAVGLDPNSPYLSSTETLLETPKKVNQFNHTRLPIHTERAIYRLSHMKLTNPRRPLHDQVTISNLMFWYLSVISQTSAGASESEPTTVPMNAMTMKACRMQIKHQQQKNNKNKRRMRHQSNQIRPENSNAMDMFHQQQKNSQQQLYRQKRNVSAPTLGARRYQRTHLRSSNSSSDEEDSDSGEEFSSSSDELDNSQSLDFEDLFIRSGANKKIPSKKSKKYSLFTKNDKSTTSWLPSFSSPKQHEVVCTREDEDDIPLAMYQKSKN